MMAEEGVGVRKYVKGCGRDRSGWILDHALGKVWPRLEEVSFVTPSCEKGTSGCGSLLDDRPKEMLTDGHMVHTLTDKHIQ